MGELVLIMGPTGAGKTVQAERLAAERGWTHFSTGRMLRQDPAVAMQLRAGHLAPSAEVQRVLAAAVVAVPRERGVVLDGFPRTVDQAEWLDTQLAEWGRSLTAVILVDVDEATSQARLAQRGRSDDTAAAQSEKWHDYQTLMAPVAEYYRSRDQLQVVDGRGSIEDVEVQIRTTLS